MVDAPPPGDPYRPPQPQAPQPAQPWLTPATPGGYGTSGGYGAPVPSPSNGLATAALVLGIVSLVLCQWMFLPGLVAFILGLVAAGTAKKIGGVGLGKARAGWILGLASVVVGVAVWVFGTIAFVAAIIGFAENLDVPVGDVADPGTYSTMVDTCDLSSDGLVEMTVTLRNRTAFEQTFVVKGAFIVNGSEAASDRGSVDVPARGTAAVALSATVPATTARSALRCDVAEVYEPFLDSSPSAS